MRNCRSGLVVLVAWAFTAGCNFVTQGELEAQRACIDEDGDGAPQFVSADVTCDRPLDEVGLDTLETDCDDNDPRRAPHFAEIPYDRIDNDCDDARSDILDLDGDGYCKLTREQYEAIEVESEALAYPEGLCEPEVDCDDDPTDDPPDDCVPVQPSFADNTCDVPAVLCIRAANINPGASDTPYDGVDANCDGEEDYDLDGDGIIPTRNPQTGCDHSPPYTGLLDGGDCDDLNPDVFPGNSAEDIFYDGVDTNCDCANDYDADGDGYIVKADVPEDQVTLLDLAQFAALYGCEDLEFEVDVNGDPLLDCNDDISSSQAQLQNPGATEIWYDGIDQDCGEDNDFDQDGDGIDCDRTINVNCQLEPGEGDCNDQDPAVYAGQLEVFGDGIDQDCDGSGDFSRMAATNAIWDGVSAPDMTYTGEHLVAYLAVDEYTGQNASPSPNTFVFLRFDKTLSQPTLPRLKVNFQGGVADISHDVIIESLGDGDFYLADSITTAGQVFLRVTKGAFDVAETFNYKTSPVFHSVGNATNSILPSHLDLAIWPDAPDGTPDYTVWSTMSSAGNSVTALPYVGLVAFAVNGTVNLPTTQVKQGTRSFGEELVLMDLDFSYGAPAIGYLWDGVGYLPLHLASGSLTSGPYFVDLSTSATPPDAYAGMAPGVVERDEDRIASIDAATGVLTVTGPDFVVDVFNGGNEIALQAQTAVGADGTLYVASVIEDPGTDALNEGRTLAVLTWGDPTDWAATRQQYVVPYKSSTYYPSGGVYPDLEEPTGLAVGVSEDVISLVLSTNPIPSAIAGTTGNVYWMTVTL